MYFPGGFSKKGNMCFTVKVFRVLSTDYRGPVIREEKIPGNRGEFCQMVVRGSCFPRSQEFCSKL